MALEGLSRGSLPGLLIAGIGGALIHRGVTGRCNAYNALGINTATPNQQSTEEQVASRGVRLEQALLINRSAEELYAFWRNFTNLPQFMTHLESVSVLDDRRSHWVAKAKVPGGNRLEWDAEITQDEPNRLIAWRSLPGADVDNTGQIRFEKALGDRGTEVHVNMDYIPPAGRVGHWVAKMLGNDPSRILRENLRNFKQIMEIGEVPTIIGQPHGTCTGQGTNYTESEWKPLFT